MTPTEVRAVVLTDQTRPLMTTPLRECPTHPGFFIYALVDPRTSEIRYVGKVQGYLNTRLKAHIHEATTTTRVTHKLQWIRSVIAAGVQPVAKVISQHVRRDSLAISEREWIAKMRAAGVRLVNATDGGEGMPNPSPETRAKLRARGCSFTQAMRDAATAARIAKARTPEARARRAENEAERRRIDNPKMAELGPEGYRAWQVENCRRMAAARVEREKARGISKTPEHRSKISETLKKRYADGLPHPSTYLPRATHCKRSHEYTPENTVIQTPTGGRGCRQCKALRHRERMMARKEAKAGGEPCAA